MSNLLRFTVYGLAQPKGSTKSFGYVAKDKATGRPRTRTTTSGKVVPVILTATTSDNPRNKGWQQLVAESAAVEMNRTRFRQLPDGPVKLGVQFYLARPKSLKDRQEPHLTRPDLDKLARSVKDALSKVAWRDDSQVVVLMAGKQYAEPGGGLPRAEVLVEALPA